MSDETEEKKTRKKRGSINKNTEQTEIPGTAPARDKELEALGKLAAELTDNFKEARDAMSETRNNLKDMMIAKGITEYHLTKLARPRWLRIKKVPDKLAIEMDKDGGDPTDADDPTSDTGAGGVDITVD